MNPTLPEPLASAGSRRSRRNICPACSPASPRAAKSFADVEPAPARSEDLIAEERVKRELHPLDAYEQIVENAVTNKAPDKEEIFRFKWNGLFFLTPVKDAFMARLRIPGGVVTTFQLRELARIAQELTSGYVQITTRANFQMRLIQPKDAPEVLRRIQSVGLHTRGSGADNIRNLTANPTAGIDPVELIDVQPFCAVARANHHQRPLVLRSAAQVQHRLRRRRPDRFRRGHERHRRESGEGWRRNFLPHRARRRDRPQGVCE